MKSKITIILGMFLAIFLISCENQSSNLPDNTDEIIIEDEINSLKYGEIGDEDSQQPIFGSHHHNFWQRVRNHRFNRDCITVTTSGEGYPKEIVIDYGEGCEGRHGELKTGKIIITMSDDIFNAGAEHVIKFEDVMIGEKSVELTKTRTNTGQNEEENWVMESSMVQTITYEDGSSSIRNSNGKNEWLSGFGTEEKEDDILERSFSGTVLTSEGAEYSRQTTSPLLIDRSCLYIKSGVILLDRNGTEMMIDFGEGECDRWATVTKDGVSKLVDLSKRGKNMTGFRNKGNGNGNGNGKG